MKNVYQQVLEEDDSTQDAMAQQHLESLTATSSDTEITTGDGLSNRLNEYANLHNGVVGFFKRPGATLLLAILMSTWFIYQGNGIHVSKSITNNTVPDPSLRSPMGDSGDTALAHDNVVATTDPLVREGDRGLYPLHSNKKQAQTHMESITQQNAVDPIRPKRPTSPDLSNVTVSDCSPCPSQPPIPNKPLKNATGDKPNLTNKSLATFKTAVGKELIMLCTVKKGDLVSIQADGRILTGQGFAWNTPNGIDLEHATIPKSYFNVNPNYKHGALLYRLHHKSAWMCYNTETPPTLSATEDGQLEFLINDNFREDNQGSFDIIVKIEHTTLEP